LIALKLKITNTTIKKHPNADWAAPTSWTDHFHASGDHLRKMSFFRHNSNWLWSTFLNWCKPLVLY